MEIHNNGAVCFLLLLTQVDFWSYFLESRKFLNFLYLLESRILGNYFYFLESNKVVYFWQHCPPGLVLGLCLWTLLGDFQISRRIPLPTSWIRACCYAKGSILEPGLTRERRLYYIAAKSAVNHHPIQQFVVWQNMYVMSPKIVKFIVHLDAYTVLRCT